MADEGHGVDCPACCEAVLTGEDRAWLAEHGWREAQHIRPPSVAPPVRSGMDAGSLFVLWSAVLFGFVVAFAANPGVASVLAVLCFGPLLVLRWVRRRRHHAHGGRRDVGCTVCQRAAERESQRVWLEYQTLMGQERWRLVQRQQALDAERRRAWDQANYERLLNQRRDQG